MTQISDTELRDFCKWYKDRNKKAIDEESVFITCMCGHFHSYPKAMKEQLKRMNVLGLITTNKGTITITIA